AIANYTSCVHTVSKRDVCAQFAAQSLAGLANIKAKHSAYCGDDNGQTAIQCVENFQNCFSPFNATFFPALHSSNLSKICSSLESYTSCVSRLTPMCSRQMGVVIQSAQSLKLQYSAKCHPSTSCPSKNIIYEIALQKFTICIINLMSSGCGQMMRQNLAHDMQMQYGSMCSNDAQANTQDLMDCTDEIVGCYTDFNTTFVPAVVDYNLVLMCGALANYTTCVHTVSKRNVCAQFAAQSLAGLANIKAKHRAYCGDDILKLSTCEAVGQCSHTFIKTFSEGLFSNGDICGRIGDYFPCVERSLEECNLPQSTTDIEFGALGTLMHGYCEKVSTNARLTQCPAFVKCTTAIMVSFSPNLKNMYEGSTWCTFLQLSIGCAEYALQSTTCFLEQDRELQKRVHEMDELRMRTCEQRTKTSGNVINSGREGKDDNGKDGAMTERSTLFPTVIAILAVTSTQIAQF
ncbi:hypothetical protein PoB_002755900, partial [Plakobranchus ocellatus]